LRYREAEDRACVNNVCVIIVGEKRREETVTERRFRELALAMPEAIEIGHMGHPDFRVRGKVLATLGYPNKDWAMVKLTPEQQAVFVGKEPAAFVPVKGAWGSRGATSVRLKVAKPSSVGAALAAAWGNIVPAALSRRAPKG